MKNIQFRGEQLTPDAFDAHVTLAAEVGVTTNVNIIAHHLHATRSRATRENIAASLDRLVTAGVFVREEDFAVRDFEGNVITAPLYRRVR